MTGVVKLEDELATTSAAAILKERGYILRKLIGQGSYAKVYLSDYRSAKSNSSIVSELACKVIDTSKAPRDYLLKFLPREIDILIKLNHPHIIQVHGIFQRRSKYFVFLRFAENGDLLDFVTENGAVCEKQCRIWMKQLCLGLEYMHTLQIAHRDLKCENILISGNYNLKITDFGFSRSCWNNRCEDIESETYCGSLSYAAPEILKGCPYYPKNADMWSLGIIFYTMLNKSLPFNETSVKRLYEKQITKKWKFRSQIVDTLTIQCKRLVAELMTPDPIKRPSATDVVRGEWIAMDKRLINMTFLEESLLNKAQEETAKKVSEPMKYESEANKLAELRRKNRGKDGLKILRPIISGVRSESVLGNNPNMFK